MVSFDVTSLYLSLAYPLIINSLRTFLENAPLLDTLTAETVVELTSICLGMSTFTFDAQFFKQTKGSPMGSPLSTVVAEVVMRSLDQWITSRHSSDIFLWRRYIDDTFCLVSEVSASHILSDLNSFHPDIAFTHETENHSVLPFLDTLVIRTPSRTLKRGCAPPIAQSQCNGFQLTLEFLVMSWQTLWQRLELLAYLKQENLPPNWTKETSSVPSKPNACRNGNLMLRMTGTELEGQAPPATPRHIIVRIDSSIDELYSSPADTIKNLKLYKHDTIV
ncbi:hypothetical protein LAZ67_19002420 [Cordylochernes scorpioides]|uniref:Reverse transcriptase domain-containing protein n=1 Tax=Cordylochernes scorpioides TaxID=51811 RepID=A0ABY6LIM3_9ARAC|nr:hypothetical protein LAZ67_19002420 [Cordylochernes scorpioides]